MAQQTTLIPLAARTSTLIVDSDLDLGAYELIADKVVADKVVADSVDVATFDSDYVETDVLQITAVRIIPGNNVVGKPTGYDPVPLGYQTPKILAEWSIPALYGSDNEFDLKCTIIACWLSSGEPNSEDVTWQICVNGSPVKTGTSPTVATPAIYVNEHLDNISSSDVISITATSSNSGPTWKARTADASDIEIIGTLEPFWNIQGDLVLQE